MRKLRKNRVLIAGILSPLGVMVVLWSLALYFAVRPNPEVLNAAFLVPLSAFILATSGPFVVTLILAIEDHRHGTLSISGKIGLAVAVLSLGIPFKPARTVVRSWKQSRNMALRDVPAPQFATADLDGTVHRLDDEKGKVVLVNVWATWCTVCKAEMPTLDRLYREHKAEGFTVFGLSDEDAVTQRKCIAQIPVSYPFLTHNGDVPAIYRDIAAYPATFVIDRQGRLQPGFGGNQSYDSIEQTVVALLHPGHS